MISIKKMTMEQSDNMSMELYVDSLSELPLDGKISGYTVAPGSVAYDKTGALAICDSDGNWNNV